MDLALRRGGEQATARGETTPVVIPAAEVKDQTAVSGGPASRFSSAPWQAMQRVAAG